MDSITIPLGTMLCRVVQPLIGSVSYCYSTSALNALGWLSIVLLAAAAFGLNAVRRA